MPNRGEPGFAGQHAIITGGSSGIGLALALRLAAAGAHLTLIARDAAKLAAARHEVEAARRSAQQRVLTISADVAEREQVEGAIEEAIAANGAPHLLITSAGIAYPNYFLDIPVELFERSMAVNYFGSLYAVRAALPAMKALAARREPSRAVLVSSGAGLVGIHGYAAYSPTKFALRGLAETLRAELKPTGVGISIVYPPDTDTPQLRQENQTKPPETKRITAAAKTWSADGVARVVLRGVERRNFEIAPGLEIALLTRWHSLAAPGLRRYFDWLARGAEQ